MFVFDSCWHCSTLRPNSVSYIDFQLPQLFAYSGQEQLCSMRQRKVNPWQAAVAKKALHSLSSSRMDQTHVSDCSCNHLLCFRSWLSAASSSAIVGCSPSARSSAYENLNQMADLWQSCSSRLEGFDTGPGQAGTSMTGLRLIDDSTIVTQYEARDSHDVIYQLTSISLVTCSDSHLSSACHDFACSFRGSGDTGCPWGLPQNSPSFLRRSCLDFGQ